MRLWNWLSLRMGPGPKPGAGSTRFAGEGHSGAGCLPLLIRQTCRYLQLRNLHRFSLKSQHTSDERMPRVPVMPCGLAEKAITADSTAFRRCPNSGSSSIAREHSDVLCVVLRHRSHRVAFLAMPVKQIVYSDELSLDHCLWPVAAAC